MLDLKQYTDDQIVRLIKEGFISDNDLIDSGICPVCFNQNHNQVLYGSVEEMLLYENNDYQCLYVEKPRSNGHIVIVSKKHFKDMTELEDGICESIFVFAKQAMKCIKEVYGCESVYLCTMCDGPMNHFHIQLIPRYKNETYGSKNFTKVRKPYKEDRIKKEQLRKLLQQ